MSRKPTYLSHPKVKPLSTRGKSRLDAYIITTLHRLDPEKDNWKEVMANLGSQKKFVQCACKGTKEKGPWVRISKAYIIEERVDAEGRTIFSVMKRTWRIHCAFDNKLIYEGDLLIEGLEE